MGNLVPEWQGEGDSFVSADVYSSRWLEASAPSECGWEKHHADYLRYHFLRRPLHYHRNGRQLSSSDSVDPWLPAYPSPTCAWAIQRQRPRTRGKLSLCNSTKTRYSVPAGRVPQRCHSRIILRRRCYLFERFQKSEK